MRAVAGHLINTPLQWGAKMGGSGLEPFQPQKCVGDVNSHWIHPLFSRAGAILSVPAQSSLLVKVVPEPQKPHFLLARDAQRSVNIDVFVRLGAPDSFQWAGAFSAFCQRLRFALSAVAPAAWLFPEQEVVASRGRSDPETAPAPKSLILSLSLDHGSNIDGPFYAS